MLWILILFAIAANIVSVGLLIKDVRSHEEMYPAWKDKKIPKSVIVYMAIMICLSIAMTVFITLFYTDNHWVFTLKRVLLLALLWPIGYIDYTTYRIPNIFIITGLIMRVMVLILELITGRTGVWKNFIIELIICLAIVVISLICTLFVKNGIGYGDMKLLGLMALILGAAGTWGAVFMSLFVSFIASVVLLIRKQKSRKDSIPFGPAIMVGTYISVFLTGM